MLYHLLYPLHEQFALFNVFRYITFRTAGAIVTAILLWRHVNPALLIFGGGMVGYFLGR